MGFKVVPSKNHPEPDICDDLAGAYPKTFDFSGWHPHCRCHAEPIMKTDEEMVKDKAAILAGAEPSAGSVNAVRNVPPGFSEWVKANETKIGTARSLPYFIRDNKAVVDNILRPQPVRSALDIAKGNVVAGVPVQEEQEAAIKRRWRNSTQGRLYRFCSMDDDVKRYYLLRLLQTRATIMQGVSQSSSTEREAYMTLEKAVISEEVRRRATFHWTIADIKADSIKGEQLLETFRLADCIKAQCLLFKQQSLAILRKNMLNHGGKL